MGAGIGNFVVVGGEVVACADVLPLDDGAEVLPLDDGAAVLVLGDSKPCVLFGAI